MLGRVIFGLRGTNRPNSKDNSPHRIMHRRASNKSFLKRTRHGSENDLQAGSFLRNVEVNKQTTRDECNTASSQDLEE